MTFDPHTDAPAGKLWNTPRVAFTILTFALLTIAFSSSCGPSDSSQSEPAPAATEKASSSSPRTAAPHAPAAPRPAGGSPELPDELRATEMKTIKGQTFKLSDYAGKVVVMDLWATWCRPCRLEVPDLVQLQNDYRGRGVEVVGLTIEGFTPDELEQNAAKVGAFAQEFQINYTVGWADQNFAYTLLAPTGSIPQTFVIAPDGRIVRHFTGYYPNMGEDIRAAINDALQSKS